MSSREDWHRLLFWGLWIARPVFYKIMFPTVALGIVTERKGGAEKVQLSYTFSGFMCWGSWWDFTWMKGSIALETFFVCLFSVWKHRPSLGTRFLLITQRVHVPSPVTALQGTMQYPSCRRRALSHHYGLQPFCPERSMDSWCTVYVFLFIPFWDQRPMSVRLMTWH